VRRTLQTSYETTRETSGTATALGARPPADAVVTSAGRCRNRPEHSGDPAVRDILQSAERLSPSAPSGGPAVSHGPDRPERRISGQRTFSTRSRTRVSRADSRSEPRQPNRLEKRKNTAPRCPRQPDDEPPELCAPSPPSGAMHPFRGSRRHPAATYGHPAPVGRPGSVAHRPAAEASAGARGPAESTPARLTRSPRGGRAGSSPAEVALLHHYAGGVHTRCTSAASRPRAASSSGRSTGTGSSSPTSTVSGNT
jgi:hypothetical protein